MVKFTIFAGHSGPFKPGRMLYVTLFAGCELNKPSVAKMVLTQSSRPVTDPNGTVGPSILTIFGGTSIKYPPLADEYVDLRDLLRSGTITMEQWDRAAAAIGVTDSSIASFTLFAALDESEMPEEDEEIEALAIQRHLGGISEQAGRILQLGIGQPLAERISTVRRAVLADS